MLITFSGVVGSGKSKNAKILYRELLAAGISVVYLRFRFITWRNLFKKLPAPKPVPATRDKAERKQAEEKAIRTGRIKRLSFLRFLGYAGRILFFRMFVQIKLREKIAITDRYFWDNFAHYALRGPLEKAYHAALVRLLPRPELQFLLTASAQTIFQRRPFYDRTYLRGLLDNYEQMAKQFPHLIVLPTDDVDTLRTRIVAHVQKYCSNRGIPIPAAAVSEQS